MVLYIVEVMKKKNIKNLWKGFQIFERDKTSELLKNYKDILQSFIFVGFINALLI